MIDINEVLRLAFDKMPPPPNAFMEGLFGAVKHTTAYMRDGSVEQFTQIDLRRRPDGVWELPK